MYALAARSMSTSASATPAKPNLQDKPSELYFRGATAKLSIASVDRKFPDDLIVTAQYNPKEIEVKQPIGWAEHQSTAGQTTDELIMEFGGMKSSSMQVELLFDGAENDGYVRGEKMELVTDLIARLKELASVQDPYSPLEDLRRPHFCIVTWGNVAGTTRPFRCVIESIATKYMMFSKTGVVLRAACTLSLKEADRVKVARKEGRSRARP